MTPCRHQAERKQCQYSAIGEASVRAGAQVKLAAIINVHQAQSFELE
jgi:hypothetical protein